MPSRAVTSFLRTIAPNPRGLEPLSVNALSGCYLISTDQIRDGNRGQHFVSMPSRAVTSFLRSCDYNSYSHRTIVSMPSRAVTSFLQTGRPSYQPSLTRVSMPSRAVTSFLQYPFKNLGFMRLPEPVFAGIYQNILATAVFRAC